MPEEKVESPEAEKNVSLFLSRSNQQHLLQDPHFLPPKDPRFAICKVRVFPSIQPKPTNIFSSENPDFTKSPPLCSNRSSKKYSNPR